MIETTLKLNAEDYIGRPDLVLCNGACISFFYGEIYHIEDPEYVHYEICAEVVLYEYMPPRRASLDRSPKLDDLPF